MNNAIKRLTKQHTV